MLRDYPDIQEANQLIRGFRFGLNIYYQGPECQRTCQNLPSARSNPDIFRQKFMKEVNINRFIGPFPIPPMPHLQCSPMGLVPKKGNKGKFRMITNLSFPPGDSVNTYIPKHYSTVHYKSFDEAVLLITKQGYFCYMGKTDVESAFHLIPMNKASLRILGMVFDNMFYLDACLPFGSSKSCAIFEKFSTALEWYFTRATQHDASHYLDDFFFCNLLRLLCQQDMTQFNSICTQVGVPISQDKTEGPTQNISFLGIGIDTVFWILRVPEDKV